MPLPHDVLTLRSTLAALLKSEQRVDTSDRERLEIDRAARGNARRGRRTRWRRRSVVRPIGLELACRQCPIEATVSASMSTARP